MSVNAFAEVRKESLCRLQTLVDNASTELSGMYEQYLDAPGGSLEPFSPMAVYRIAAALELIAGKLGDESDWWDMMKATREHVPVMPESPSAA